MYKMLKFQKNYFYSFHLSGERGKVKYIHVL